MFEWQQLQAGLSGKNEWKEERFEITVEKFLKQKSHLKFDRQPHKFSNFVENKSLTKI